jgi:hypothetical protein
VSEVKILQRKMPRRRNRVVGDVNEGDRRNPVADDVDDEKTNVRPKPKEPDQSTAEYLLYFDRIIVANNWRDETAGKIFPAMFDPKDRSLESLSEEIISSGYQAIKECLLKNEEPLRESNCMKLMKVALGNEETVKSFRSRVVSLVSLVYPNFSSENQNQLARDHFVHGLPDEIQSRIMISGGKSLDSVVNVAEALMSMNVEQKDSVLGVERRIQYQKPSKGGQKKQNGSNIQRGIGEQYTCYRCGKKGHIARYCKEVLPVFSGNEEQLLLSGEQ